MCTLTLRLQPARRLLHLGLLLQVMRWREWGEPQDLGSPRSNPPPRSPPSGIWPPDGSRGQGKEGPFWAGGPDPSGVPGGEQRMRRWLDVLSPNSRSSLAGAGL